MRNESHKAKIFTRRSIIMGGIKLGLISVLGGRLYYLQGMRSDEFKTLSEDNRIKLQLIAPPRGRILDRNGEVLALNTDNYQLMFDKSRKQKYSDELALIASILNLDDATVNDVMQKITKARRNSLMNVLDYLTWEQVAAIEVNKADLGPFEINTGTVRNYPLVEETAHMLGYLGAVSEQDNPTSPLLKMPDFKIGKNGIEKHYEDRLRGAPGIRKIEVDAHGFSVRELSHETSTPGDDLVLAINKELQQYTYEILGEHTGSIVVMDVKTGEVVAYVSKPAYDPNIISKAIDQAYWKQLLEDPGKPLINKAIAGQYPPGSTFKMMTAIAALEAGVVNANTSFHCPGHVDLGSHRFHCWKRGGHGSVNVVDAIAESCDTYFYLAGQRAGVDKVAEVSRRFGLGGKTGNDLPGEKSGLVPTQAWKKKRYKQPWLQGETLNISIGQGYMLTTPLQLAVMTARLVNGGYAVVPRLLKLKEDEKLPEPEKITFNPKHMELILRGMYESTNTPRGTAFGKRIMDESMAMGGKTGTAQVKKILRSGGNSIKETRREFKHHAWYVGYAPYNEPHFAVAVLVEHGEGGSKTAAPIARDVLIRAQELILNKKYAGATPPPAPTPAPAIEPEPEIAEEQNETSVEQQPEFMSIEESR